MKTYVALLRGINVGGNNTISMAKLTESFASRSFKNVTTYINSGNVIFTSTLTNEKKIVTAIEELIQTDFNLTIPVIIRDKDNITKICKVTPTQWTNNAAQKTDVMFLWEDYARKSILGEIKTNEKVDTLRYISGAILWHLKKKDHTKSAISKIVGTKIYKNMTVRNINTVRKIHERMKS